MKKINTRSMVEGAIFASLTAVLGILVYYMPLVSLIGMFWAVPIIIVGFRNGFKVSFISAVVAAILVSIFTEPYSGIYLFLVFGISGIVMGNLMNKDINPSLNIAVSGLILAVCSVFGILMSFWLMGQSPAQAVEYFIKTISQSIESAIEIYNSMGIPQEQIEGLVNTLRDGVEGFRITMPTFFLMNGIIFSFINFKVVKIILNRMKYKIKDIKIFSYWRLPENFSLGLVIVLFLTIASTFFKLPNIEGVAVNLILLLRWIFVILGLSVSAFLLNKYNVNKVFKYIILFLLFVALSNLLTIVGLVDAIFNLRKIGNENGGEV